MPQQTTKEWVEEANKEAIEAGNSLHAEMERQGKIVLKSIQECRAFYLAIPEGERFNELTLVPIGNFLEANYEGIHTDYGCEGYSIFWEGDEEFDHLNNNFLEDWGMVIELLYSRAEGIPHNIERNRKFTWVNDEMVYLD